MAVPDAAHGSGALVTGDGLILTAKHVVDGARLLAVQLISVGFLPANSTFLASFGGSFYLH